jgi:hypothetical protein
VALSMTDRPESPDAPTAHSGSAAAPTTGHRATTHADLFDDDRRSGARRGPVVAIAVAALVLGAVAGGLAARAYDNRQRATAAKSRLSVVAALTSVAPPVDGHATVGVTYTNFGDYPVRVGPLTFAEAALSGTPRDPEITVPEGKSATQVVATTVDCSAVGAARSGWSPDTTATVTMTTADGTAHDESIELTSGGPLTGGLELLTDTACGSQLSTFSELAAFYLGARVDGDRVVAQIIIGDIASVGQAATNPLITLTSVDVGDEGASDPPEPAWHVVAAGALPATVTPGQFYDFVWTVTDCGRAQELNATDLTVTLNGTLDNSGGSVTVEPDASLITKLVSLTFGTCGAPAD